MIRIKILGMIRIKYWSLGKKRASRQTNRHRNKHTPGLVCSSVPQGALGPAEPSPDGATLLCPPQYIRQINLSFIVYQRLAIMPRSS